MCESAFRHTLNTTLLVQFPTDLRAPSGALGMERPSLKKLSEECLWGGLL
jgi:hypothetical protein